MLGQVSSAFHILLAPHMPHRLRITFCAWLGYFLLLLLGALIVRDGPFDSTLFARIDDVSTWLNFSDPNTFAGAAKEIAQFGWVTEKNTWVMNLWPPGFMLLEAGIIFLFGVNAPIVLILQVLACGALAMMLSLQRSLLSRFVGGTAALVLPLLLFVFPMPRLFLFEPFGVVLGETFSVSFFISAGLLLLFAVEGRRIGLAVLAGLLLALAAYFRSQYESILMAATGLAILLGLWCLWRRRRNELPAERAAYSTILQVVTVALLVAHAAMLPWRLHSYFVAKNFVWVQTAEHIFKTGLLSDKTLIDAQGEFFVVGGGNVACHVEPTYCDQTDSSLFLKAFRAHPLKWYSYKLPKLANFWHTFTRPSAYVFSNWFMVMDTVSYYTYLLVLIATFPLLLITRKYRWWPIMAWSVASLYAACVVIFSFAHFESRYFYLLKIFAFIWCTNMAAMVWGMRKKCESPAAWKGDSPKTC